jgi:hemerythrin-like domain-containing protein
MFVRFEANLGWPAVCVSLFVHAKRVSIQTITAIILFIKAFLEKRHTVKNIAVYAKEAKCGSQPNFATVTPYNI